MSPEDYRAKWGLTKDYPMAAPAYAATRSALAKEMGLGFGGRAAKAQPAKPALGRPMAAKLAEVKNVNSFAIADVGGTAGPLRFTIQAR
jgi:hypothetical protein